MSSAQDASAFPGNKWSTLVWAFVFDHREYYRAANSGLRFQRVARVYFCTKARPCCYSKALISPSSCHAAGQGGRSSAPHGHTGIQAGATLPACGFTIWDKAPSTGSRWEISPFCSWPIGQKEVAWHWHLCPSPASPPRGI